MTIIFLIVLIAAFVAGEMAVRLVGLTDFPLYVPDDHAGYITRPRQRGRFLNRFGWSYDGNGMRAVSGVHGPAGATILLGDSVVAGGNLITQSRSLAARLHLATEQAVYPVACGGWALANALAALEHLPRWREAKRIVLVINRGDFDTVGKLDDPFARPTRYPFLALPWLARKYFHRGKPDQLLPELRQDNLATIARLVGEFAGPIAILRYPFKGDPPGPEEEFLELAAAAPGSRLIDLATCSEWGADCYADHIHPNPEGIDVLARFIAQEIA